MSHVSVSPEMVAASVTDLSGIRTAISAAEAIAAAATTQVLAPAADEVSAAIAEIFSAHGQAYEALSAQTASFHDQFIRILTASAESYAGAEAVDAKLMEVHSMLNESAWFVLFAPLDSAGGLAGRKPRTR